jgi:hypothetical protein
LLVSLVEVGMLALVLPGEAALLPHVGPSGSAIGLQNRFLERVELAAPIHFLRPGHIKQVTQIKEVLVRGGLLRPGGPPPPLDELLRGHG